MLFVYSPPSVTLACFMWRRSDGVFRRHFYFTLDWLFNGSLMKNALGFDIQETKEDLLKMTSTLKSCPFDPSKEENWKFHDEYEFWYIGFPEVIQPDKKYKIDLARERGFKPWEEYSKHIRTALQRAEKVHALEANLQREREIIDSQYAKACPDCGCGNTKWEHIECIVCCNRRLEDKTQGLVKALDFMHTDKRLVLGKYDYQCGFLDALDTMKKQLSALNALIGEG